MVDFPLENLDELFAAAMECRPMDFVAAEWVVRGVLQALRREETLDVALGLSRPGQGTLRRRFQTINRDNFLRAALLAVGLDVALSDWERCKRLAPLIQRFMSTEWKSARQLDAPANDWPQWKSHVFRAAQCEAGMPRTAHGLRKLVNRNAPYRVNCRTATVLARYL